MRIPEAASMLGVSSMTIMRRISTGKLSARKVGREWDIPMDEVVAQLPLVQRQYIAQLQARIVELEKKLADCEKARQD